MLKCPFCHFDNEDGALFCDQCKSDLSSVVPAMSGAAAAPPVPVVIDPMPIAVEAIPVSEESGNAVPILVEAIPVEAIPMIAEAVAVEATPVEAVPMIAEAISVSPVNTGADLAIPAWPISVEPIPVVPEPVVPEPVVPEPVAAIPIAPVPVQAVPVQPVPVAPEPVQPVPTPPVVPVSPPVQGAAGAFPDGAQPRLLVMRGSKRNVEYPIFEGPNFVGRADDKPVDIDLEEQEPPDRVWCSRQHCCIFFENNELSIEDLNSSNGTFVNRARIYPGQKTILAVGDVVQIGNVQMKVVV